MGKPRIAIIGAGFSGLLLARELTSFAEITLFEKARGVGGRLSTRYAPPFEFDHGAPFFTVSSPLFQKFLEPFIGEGLLQPWNGEVVKLNDKRTPQPLLSHDTRLVACPHMNSLCKQWAMPFSLALSREVQSIARQSTGWFLSFKNHADIRGPFDWLISTAPPRQTTALFNNYIPHASPIHDASMLGCYALMVGLHQSWEHAWTSAYIEEGPLQSIMINSSKPMRSRDLTCIVAHTHTHWAEQNLEEERYTIQRILLSELQKRTDIHPSPVDYITTHRWRYARSSRSKNAEGYCDLQKRLAAIGDWCTLSTLESLWFCVLNMAHKIRDSL
jgi:predicted NAD/FAD-dependent oxidoreductase